MKMKVGNNIHYTFSHKIKEKRYKVKFVAGGHKILFSCLFHIAQKTGLE